MPFWRKAARGKMIFREQGIMTSRGERQNKDKLFSLLTFENNYVLEAIAPGRIDLGVGRAPGSDRMTAMALNPDPNAAANFPNQVLELGCWLRGEPLPAGHPFREIRAHPQGTHGPGDLDSRQLRLRRTARGALRAPVCVCVFLHRGSGYRGGPLALPTQLSRERRSRPAVGNHLRLGACRRYRGRSEAPADDARTLARGLRDGAAADTACVTGGRGGYRTPRRNGRSSSASGSGPLSATPARSRRSSTNSRQRSASTKSSSIPGPTIRSRDIARTS